MAKIGTSRYPIITFSDALDIAQKIADENIQTVKGLAHSLGHKSPRSGAFKAKKAALNKYYGLVDQDKSEISLTTDGEELVYGHHTEAEKKKIARDAIMGIPLFRELWESLGPDYNKHDFAPTLRSITGADPKEVAEKESKIRRLYEDIIPYLETAQKPPSASNEQRRDQEGGSDGPPSPDIGEASADVFVFQSGETYLRAEKNKETLNLLQNMIDAWKSALD